MLGRKAPDKRGLVYRHPDSDLTVVPVVVSKADVTITIKSAVIPVTIRIKISKMVPVTLPETMPAVPAAMQRTRIPVSVTNIPALMAMLVTMTAVVLRVSTIRTAIGMPI